MAAHDRVAET